MVTKISAKDLQLFCSISRSISFVFSGIRWLMCLAVIQPSFIKMSSNRFATQADDEINEHVCLVLL